MRLDLCRPWDEDEGCERGREKGVEEVCACVCVCVCGGGGGSVYTLIKPSFLGQIKHTPKHLVYQVIPT